MGISDRLRSLDKRAGAGLGGGFLRARRADESLRGHLRYMADNGGFGTNRVAQDVLGVLDRLEALEQRVAALEQQR
jgi:hypothetical protein